MVYGHTCFRTPRLGRLSTRYLPTHKPNLTFDLIIRTCPSATHHYLSILTPSGLLLVLDVVLWEHFLSRWYLTLPPQDSPTSSALSPRFSPIFLCFPLTYRASHTGIVCFRLRVEHIWV